jgi:hypothetical protein
MAAVAVASPRPPMRVHLGPDAEGGRGLAVVEAFSSRWGWHTTTMAGLAKVTWAEWRLPPAAGQPPVSAERDQALTPTSR